MVETKNLNENKIIAQELENDLIVSSSPHIFSKDTTSKIMLDVLIALLPATIASVIIFGLQAFILVVVCTASAVLAEWGFQALCKQKITISDLSAAVTGLLLALNLPASVTWWQAIIGSVIAVVVVKGLFGGIGKNFANPAITARIILLLAFEMMIGLRGGAIGETCSLALILGGVYLMIRKVITWHTPVIFVGCVFLFTLILNGSLEFALYEVLSGGLLIGAIFMATDYSTTPSRAWGKVIFAVGCAIITVAIRMWGSYPEGVSFAILFMNILTPYIDKLTRKRPFGGVR